MVQFTSFTWCFYCRDLPKNLCIHTGGKVVDSSYVLMCFELGDGGEWGGDEVKDSHFHVKNFQKRNIFSIMTDIPLTFTTLWAYSVGES